MPAGTIYPTLLARSERTGLLLAGRRGPLDQGRGLACVNLVLEAEHRRVFSAHYLRHHEAHVDPRIAHRYGDRVAEPRPTIALGLSADYATIGCFMLLTRHCAKAGYPARLRSSGFGPC
jgi:hypothetical protein